MVNFPVSLPGLKNDFDNADPVASADQNDSANEVNAIGAKVGVDASAVTTSHDYKLSGVTGTDKAVSKTGIETLTNKTLTSPKVNEDVAVTASATELNVLDGIPATLTPTELGYVDGVTSAIQTQLGTKAPIASPTFTGTVTLPVALSGISLLTSGVVSAVAAPTGTIVGTTDSQVLSAKTIASHLAYADTRIYAGTLTRENDAATADVAYTGIGFAPKAIIFDFYYLNVAWGHSVADAVTNNQLMKAIGTDSVRFYRTNRVIHITNGTTWDQNCNIKTWDADGFTLAWTRAGASAAGTIYVYYMAYR